MKPRSTSLTFLPSKCIKEPVTMSANHSSESYPPQISQAELSRLIAAAKDWAAANGLCVRPPPSPGLTDLDPAAVLAAPAPVTLFPSPIPRACFEQAWSIQKAYNELYAHVSQDEPFLEKMVKDVSQGDEFIANLWKIHRRVKQEGYVHKISLGLFRSDYMVHQVKSNPPKIQQVEFNTIAASFGGLSTRTSALHRFLAQTEYPYLSQPLNIDPSCLPPNNTAAGLAKGLAVAHQCYGESKSGNPLCVLFLVQTGERNVFDQRHVEYELRSQSITVFRLNLEDILAHTQVASSASRELVFTLPTNAARKFEVSVVYFRGGYGPEDYPNTAAWEARYHIERSAAAKCPTVLTQLAGAKKVQQVLAVPDTLRRFVDDQTAADKLLASFTNIYPMDGVSAEGLYARQMALSDTECVKYVLKPQREGGGNNIYRAAIPKFLRETAESHWDSYILMELITPPAARNTILRHGKTEEGGVIAELGIYGTCVWKVGTDSIVTMVHNEEAGFLLRTKGDKSEEGGVAAGFGCMDSVLLS